MTGREARLVLLRGDEWVDHGALDEAGTETVAVDAVLGVVEGDLARDADDGVLGGDVAGPAGHGDQAEHAGRVDDPAARAVAAGVRGARLLRQHLRDGVLAAEPDGALVDGVRTVIVLRGRVVDAQRQGLFDFGRDACACPSRKGELSASVQVLCIYIHI